ncbi:MAG: MBL fold metallo-hydrolase [Burkholderiales bacterium]|nr:MBL fold metallo-hydrolase [Burkholderiales bacterium]
MESVCRRRGAPLSAIRFGAVSVYFGEKSGKYPDGNLVIVQGADTRVSFDTPLVANRVGKAFDDVDLVILGHVHEDHMAGLHRVPNAQVQVHNADLHAAQSWDGLAAHYGYEQKVLDELLPLIEEEFNYAPRPDATGYKSDASWDLGGGVRVRAHHLPGHTSGHCALMVESEGVAFIGDIDLTGFGPYYGDRTSSLPAFRRTLSELPFLDAKVWVTSHHRGVLRDRGEFLGHLDRFKASIDQRSEKLLGYLEEGPHTLQQLVDRRLIYPPGYNGAPYIEAAERRTIRQHIDELKAAGLVDVDRETFSLA